MPSDFADAGKRLKDGIPVPELRIGTIRERSRAHDKQARLRIAGICVVALAVLVSGTSLAQRMFGGIRVWLSGSKAAITLRSLTTIPDPSASDLKSIIADATFPVTLPVGIPPHEHIIRVIYSPADHPSVIAVIYRDVENRVLRQFIAADSSSVEHGNLPMLPNGESPKVGQLPHWEIGRETVLFVDSTLRDGGASIQSAMSHVTPAQSFAQTLPMFYRIAIVGDGSYEVADNANAIAPTEGRSVLLDREVLTEIPVLARTGRSLFTNGKSSLENIKTVNGNADLGHVTSRFEKKQALSTQAVRAVAALLASGACGAAPKFTCEVLVNERDGKPYRLWTFAMPAPHVMNRYSVDSRTYRVKSD